MKLDKNLNGNVDKVFAQSVVQRLRCGDRVFGNTALSLQNEIKHLEEMIDEANQNRDTTDWDMGNTELHAQIRALKQSSKEIETLGDYIAKIVKDVDELDNIVAFTSLSSKDGKPSDDFILLSGDKVLILHTWAIKTDPEMPLYINENTIYLMSKELCEIDYSSVDYWESKLPSDIQVEKLMVIINKTGCNIWKNKYYEVSKVKMCFIADLKSYLISWMSDKPMLLDSIVKVGQEQERKENSGLDLSYAKHRFGI